MYYFQIFIIQLSNVGEIHLEKASCLADDFYTSLLSTRSCINSKFGSLAITNGLGFQFWVYHFLTVQLWTGYLTSKNAFSSAKWE